MTLELTSSEVTVIYFHLNANKKHIKKGLKKAHGAEEGKAQYEMYKDMVNAFDGIEITSETVDVHLDSKQKNSLKEFITWYTTQLKQVEENDDQAKNTIGILQSISEKVGESGTN